MKAGQRSPEDIQNHTPTKQQQQNAERMSRIINNDQENIPYGT